MEVSASKYERNDALKQLLLAQQLLIIHFSREFFGLQFNFISKIISSAKEVMFLVVLVCVSFFLSVNMMTRNVLNAL